MLQQRGKVTAIEVAEELEISERTARRDLDALGMAGLPVYSTQGRGGGWRLAGGGRTDLSGLNAAEARALFLVAGPHPDATPEVKAALRKLIRALPEPLRDRAEAAAASTVVDPTAWGRGERRSPPPLLAAVQSAVIDAVQLRLDYVDRAGNVTTRTVHPLGVAAKGASWYLVAGTDAGRRTFRIDRIRDAVPTGDPADRPADFDLAATWADVVSSIDAHRAPVVASARATPDILKPLRYVLGTRITIGAALDDGRIEVAIRGHHADVLAAEIAGFGSRLEVLDPIEVRDELARIGQQLVAAYARNDRALTRSSSMPSARQTPASARRSAMRRSRSSVGSGVSSGIFTAPFEALNPRSS